MIMKRTRRKLTVTIKEKLETIKGKKIAIWCEEEWMADKLYLSNGEEYNSWRLYKNLYCCDLEETDKFCYSDYGYYQRRDNLEIIKYNDFVSDCEQNKIIVTQQDINKILNDKYGKDNWVIK
jgi:hypothetical protein